MGEHWENGAASRYRELLLLQRRTVSFLLVFSVMAVVFFVFIVCIQTKRASCQVRADTAMYYLYMRSLGKEDTFIHDLTAAFKDKGVRAEPMLKEEHSTRTIDVYDTKEGTLASSGFRLIRHISDVSIVWQLLYLDEGLCHPGRRISMEALPNVDYEKVFYRTTAVTFKGKRVFLQGTDVVTKDHDRVATFQQLQSLFPGFSTYTASLDMLVTDSVKVKKNFAVELYYGFTPLDIELHFEKRGRSPHDTVFWRVKILSRNIFAERTLERVYKLVVELVTKKNITCDKHACGKAYDNPFFF